jgi:hypothetical protein
MANKKITELPLILSGDISSNDVFPIVDVELDITNKVTVDQLKGYFISGLTDTYITGGTFNPYSGVITFTNNLNQTFDIGGFSVSDYRYVPSGVTVTVPTNTQKFIYGDIVIDGELIIEDGGELFVLNGNVIASGGTITQFGDIVTVDLPEFNTFVTNGTFNPTTKQISFTGNFGFIPFNVDLSSLSTDNFYTTGATLNGNVVEFNRNDLTNAYSVDLSSLKFTGGTVNGETNFTNGVITNSISATTYLNLPFSEFTGNTSGNCITDLWVTNINGCSPVNVQDDLIVNGSVFANELNGNSILDEVTLTTFSGTILRTGIGTTVQGKVYYLNNSNNWTLAKADATLNANGLLGVAVGTDPSIDGMLVNGLAKNVIYTGTTGSPLYLSTNDGDITEYPPAGVGLIIRVVGYKLGSPGSILFNPDPTWIELS